MTKDEALAKAAQYRTWAEVLGNAKITSQAMVDEAQRLEAFARSKQGQDRE